MLDKPQPPAASRQGKREMNANEPTIVATLNYLCRKRHKKWRVWSDGRVEVLSDSSRWHDAPATYKRPAALVRAAAEAGVSIEQ